VTEITKIELHLDLNMNPDSYLKIVFWTGSSNSNEYCPSLSGLGSAIQDMHINLKHKKQLQRCSVVEP
jgi:hypothetical protein